MENRKQTKWTKRWNVWIAARPSRPGVWRRKEGGYLVRARPVDPRTGRPREILKVLDGKEGLNAVVAQRWLLAEVERIKKGVRGERPKTTPRFRDYAVSLVEQKHTDGKIMSTKTLVCLESMFKVHLFPAFGDVFIDKIGREEVEAWKRQMVAGGEYSPVTINNVLRVLKDIVGNAVADFDLDKDPLHRVALIEVVDGYTMEQPNSLTMKELKVFLTLFRERWPEHFAMVTLGFMVGLRPSSLRPLRREGREPDVLWDEGLLLVRRSQTVGEAVMETTKAKKKHPVALPREVMDVLRWHVDELPEGPMRGSELLFPSRTGRYRAGTVLIKPFADVEAQMKLKKHITPKGMRRTFQDLARAAAVERLVQQAICGHYTDEMTELYSTVSHDEMRSALGKVISMTGFRELAAGLTGRTGGQTGGQGAEERLAS